MIRIGIIGSDNSHAQIFSKLANLPGPDGSYAFDDVRVEAIFGLDPARTAQVAEEGKIPLIVKSPEEMFGRVDAVMVVFRNGVLHSRYALPFVEAGVPTWVDKPFAIDYEQALSIVAAAKKRGTLLAGGSTCKYCRDVLTLRDCFERLRAGGGVLSGAFNFPGDIESEYGGIYFYGGHSAEMLTTIFGPDVRSVKTDVHRGRLIALMKYDDFAVTVNFANVQQYYGTIYSPDGVVCRPIDIASIYRAGFTKFVEALRQGRMIEDFRSLLRPVRILNALAKSIEDGGLETAVQPVEEP